jgi:hypothetical protein
MKKEVYEALKTRITVTAKMLDVWHWEFDSSDLNEGVEDCFSHEWIDSMCQDMRMHRANLWNISERVHKFLRWMTDDVPNLDDRLIANPLKK